MTVGIAEISAATKKVTVIETTSFLTSIDCDHCEKKVMNYMPTQKGIKEVVVNLPTKVITVSYDSSKTSEKTIIKAFGRIDVEAEVIENAPANSKPAQSNKSTQQPQSQPQKR